MNIPSACGFFFFFKGALNTQMDEDDRLAGDPWAGRSPPLGARSTVGAEESDVEGPFQSWGDAAQ